MLVPSAGGLAPPPMETLDSALNPILTIHCIINNSNNKQLQKETTHSKIIHCCLFTMYSKNVSATNHIITRQPFLDNW